MSWLGTVEAAEYCGCHPVTIRRAVLSGQLKGYQRIVPKGPWKFQTSDLDRWITGGK